MPPRFNALFRGVALASRWGMAPLCLGLIVALLILVVQFCRQLGHMIAGLAAMGDGEVMIAVLKLVDLALIANLVIMIIGAAIEMLAPCETAAGGAAAPEAVVDFGVIKLRLFASISAIAAIYLLERFIDAGTGDKTEIFWEIMILLSFVVSGVLLALMDRLTSNGRPE